MHDVYESAGAGWACELLETLEVSLTNLKSGCFPLFRGRATSYVQRTTAL